MPKIIIAIDGYSSCGKSTTAKAVAARMGYGYIDTGAMYRAVSLFFIQQHVALTNPKEVAAALDQIHITFNFNPRIGRNETCLNGLNVEEEIRKMYISNYVSEVSAIPEVRWAMVAQQQKMARRRGVVMDGRDIGTKVFPDAEVKVFMSADTAVRAFRRQRELLEKGELVDIEDITANIEKRDRIDTSRAESPLIQAPDAVPLDTTHMTIEEQIDWVVALADRRIAELYREGHFAQRRSAEADSNTSNS
ncbi:(d)CMP kinase [Rudanella paleaurantiibacter]|uniref:Cytidylate kinase n=1 Tax=Rudanella paleaurantiibacter TaxID=2614655 RepID=A0A7J5U5T8_9BACT|nr:(d)CMP kinase [Rudanella paleaurantiibacter]KAB7733011.1 (d)CMP kinase [Rudanella paleaurantiibacter]